MKMSSGINKLIHPEESQPPVQKEACMKTHDAGSDASLGFIGLGNMGGPMAANLLKAGFGLTGFDLRKETMEPLTPLGGKNAASAAEVIRKCDVVMTSLPCSEIFERLAVETLIPASRRGQVFIDFGTVEAEVTRHTAKTLKEKGAGLLDAPVSGGPGGAASGNLYVFVGGEKGLFQQFLPLFEVIGDSRKITYCGPSGSGQIMKGVNQLMMALTDAAYIEAVAFGVRSGLDAETIVRAIGNEGRWRKDFNSTASRIASGEGEKLSVKWRELPYFINEAARQGRPLPIARAVFEFCREGNRVVKEISQMSPSFWRELLQKEEKGNKSPSY